MKILLLNPSLKIRTSKYTEKIYIRAGSRWPFSVEKFVWESPLYIPFPFFLAYTAAILLKANYEVKVLDAVALDLDEIFILEKIKHKNPDIILLETTTLTFEYDIKLIKKIKQIVPQVIIILTGTHATIFYQDILKNYTEIDFIIRGEYEVSTKILLDCLRQNVSISAKGIYFRKGQQISGEGYSEIINPLDILPIPARELFPDDEHPDIFIYKDAFCQYFPSIQMQLSRGCPYRCYFCLWNQVIYRNSPYRTFSIKRAVDEIEYLVKKYQLKELYFDDDDFTVKKDYVINICKEIIKRNLNIKWSCMGNATHLDEETIYWMKNAGCIGIKFGVETGDEKLAKTVGKPIDLEKVKYIAKLLNKYNIKTHATFTFGLLKETKHSMYKTIEYAKKLAVNSVQFSICTPYPGTKFYKVLAYKNYLYDYDYSKLNGSSCCSYQYPTVSSKDIEKFFNKSFRKWLIHKLCQPIWVYKELIMITRIVLFGGFESQKVLLKVIFILLRRWLLRIVR
ncbi:MAG: radical SAM protein [Endomicrobia bacterium]|nr:radical SAM protein [Endomicrobiia bacterium]MDW8055176.1 radical SAM protein [Elusimicrobiota bacterium]